jgi:hypothetical protein
MTGDKGGQNHYDENTYPARGTMMKRFLVVIPLILLILMNACSSDPTNADIATFVAQQTATLWTPTVGPIATPDIGGSQIVAYLNSALRAAETSTPLDELEQNMSARYQVRDVTFPQEKDGTSTFLVETNCECAANGQCCSYEQTFVKTMRAMYANSNQIIPLVPGQVKYMNVYCYDHASQYVVMHVLWSDVKEFLYGRLTGSQLASRVSHN